MKLGVVFKSYALKHIKDAKNLHASGQPADLTVNCSGLQACKLGGVMDESVLPARGQTVVVRNAAPAMIATSGTDDGPDEMLYMMTRPGGGTVIGGCYQKGNWNPIPDPNLANRIIKRAVAICPELEKDFPIDILRHGVGLRPFRKGGPRVELEHQQDAGLIVHNYGKLLTFSESPLSLNISDDI